MDKTELMKDVLKVTGIAPIIAYAEPEQAVPAAKALVAGGLPVVEVLMRNEHAMGNLERIARDVPEIVAGAGTIITLDQAKAAIDHGAQFIIMPGIGRQVVEYCIDKKIPVIPNCLHHAGRNDHGGGIRPRYGQIFPDLPAWRSGNAQ